MTDEQQMETTQSSPEERLRRWRMILGGDEADGIGSACGLGLNADDNAMDKALSALYNSERGAGLGFSAPNVTRWLGDIRTYFPSSVVKVMQKDALERLNLTQMLLEPEMLESIEPDVHLVGTLISLRGVLPSKTRETARIVVKKVVDELMKRIANHTRQTLLGSLNRAVRNRRPKYNEIDWNKTIKANLKNYQPDYQTIIPEIRIGYGRKQRSHSTLRDIILCIDQSGSMAASVVYSSIFGAVMASIPAVKTSLVVFDTSVVDLTEDLHDPVEVLFSTQLGGGTDINRALRYCQELINKPGDTIMVLISDLYEGGVRKELIKRCTAIQSSGTQLIVLLALSDEGRPSYDHNIASELASLGIPAFACTPDLFPDLMAAAINKADINQWAAKHEIVTTRSDKSSQ